MSLFDQKISLQLPDWIYKIPQTCKSDTIAGVSVAIVAIPQSLAYAQLAGLPAYIGLYAGFLPTIIAALIGTSPYISTGPVAIVSLLTYSALSQKFAPGSDTFIVYAAILAILVGLVQLLFSVFKIGTLIRYVSYPVIFGFVNAAVFIIALSQVKTLFGISIENGTNIGVYTMNLISQLSQADLVTSIIGIWSLIFLLVMHKIMPKLPGVLFVTVLATGICYLVGFTGATVGMIPQGFPPISIPMIEVSSTFFLIIPAIFIALVGYMEGYSISKKLDPKKTETIHPNTELVAQGAANVTSGFVGAFPVAGSISRTALNHSIGARSNLASVIVGVSTLLVLLFFTPLFYYLPIATLSAIIIYAVLQLISVHEIHKALNGSMTSRIVAVVTFVATLAFAPHLEYGLFIGIVLSLILRGVKSVHL